MATQAYHNWVQAGRPWKLAPALVVLRDKLRAHGYTVYDLGSDNAHHLQAPTPEDHCPFSVTGWPSRHPYPWVLAIDIMPPRPGQRSRVDDLELPSLQKLGAALFAARQAGQLTWIKYMNWEPVRDNDLGGPCWHDTWQPGHLRRPSSDRGHIHLSARSDRYTDAHAADYDPVVAARSANIELTTVTGDDMADFTAEDAKGIAYTLLHGPAGPTHAVLGNLALAATRIEQTLAGLTAQVKMIGEHVDISAEELAAVERAAREGATAGAGADAIAAAVLAHLPEQLTPEAVDRTLRAVLGGLNDPPAA
jgi:hypothetical protein